MKKNNDARNAAFEKAGLIAGGLTLTLTAAALSITTFSAPAQADDISNSGPCPGQLVASYPMNENLGTVEVYYARVDGGSNCFKLVAGKTKGTAALLKIEGSVDGAENSGNIEEGFFKSFAGPIAIKGTKGRCISFSASVTDGEQTYRQGWNARHCG